MASVALIGPDGAGKTTLARMLEASDAVPCRYLYMGVDISASNIALPTSRLAERLKRRARSGRDPEGPGEPDGRRTAPKAKGWTGRVRAVLRLVNRLAEEVYRQIVATLYQLRGYVVLYDRHFTFDFAREIEITKPDTLDRRLHRRFLSHLYPEPDLVIFLDAPGAVLYARKGESSAEELERRRQAYLRQGEGQPNFVAVDATQPLDHVYDQVLGHLKRLHGGRKRQTEPAR